jgi:hypothetical protein
LQKKRIRYFLGKQEKSDYDAAPYEPEGRTEEQRKAVRFYHRIRDILEQYSNFNTIHQEVQDAREDIYGQNNLGSSSSYGYIPSHIFYNPSGYGSHYQPYNPYGYNSHYHEYYRGNDGFFEETYSATPIHGKSPYRANVSYGCAVSVTQMLLRDQKMVVVQSRRIALSRL